MKLAFTLFLAGFVLTASAQSFSVPKNVKMDKAEDFEKYHEDILACINWLQETPITKEEKKRKDASAFFLRWVTGTPYITMTIYAGTLFYVEDNPDLMTIFLGGWAKYALENPDEKDNQLEGNMAGIKAVIAFYEANKKNMKRDKQLEKLAKKDDAALREWVQEQMQAE